MEIKISNICKRLKAARQKSGFKSARNFANDYNIAESTYIQHESGKRTMNLSNIIKYSNILKINTTWLLTGIHLQKNKQIITNKLIIPNKYNLYYNYDLTTNENINIKLISNILLAVHNANHQSYGIKNNNTLLNLVYMLYNHFIDKVSKENEEEIANKIKSILQNTFTKTEHTSTTNKALV